MRGKLFLLAVMCVSFVQVRGDPELENAIKKGLERLIEVARGGANELLNFKEFVFKLSNDTQERFKEIETAAKEGLVEAEKAVRNVANLTREKAEESRLPESVDKCIDNFESKAIENMSGLFEELRKQGINHLSLTLDNIQSFRAAMTRRESQLSDELKATDNKIRSCRDVKSVDYAVSTFESKVSKLQEDIKWIIRQLQDVSNDYEKQVNSYYSEFKLNLAKIKSFASRDIRLCVIDMNTIIKLLLNIME